MKTFTILFLSAFSSFAATMGGSLSGGGPVKATQAEVISGSENTKYVTPATLGGFSLAVGNGPTAAQTTNLVGLVLKGGSNIVAGSLSATSMTIPANTFGSNLVGVAKYIDVTKAPFNAYGDGIHDDSAAIQSALWYAAQSNAYPATVHMPAGSYLLSSSVRLPPNCATVFANQDYQKRWSLEGEGNVTRVIWPSRSGQAFYATNSASDEQGTNWLNSILFRNFYLIGPWKVNKDLGATFDANDDPSDITADGFRVYPVIPNGYTGFPAVGNYWRMENLYVKGFADGMAISNVNWACLEDCTIEVCSKHCLLFGGIIRPVIRRCNLGGNRLYSNAYTNDLASIAFENDAVGNAGDGAALIEDCSVGYNNLFLTCTNGRQVVVTGTGAEQLFQCFAELNANGSLVFMEGIDYLLDSNNHAPFIVAYDRALVASQPGDEMGGWFFGNVWMAASSPFIIAPNWGLAPPARLPRISRSNYGFDVSGYATRGQTMQAFNQKTLGGFGNGSVTNWAYLPAIGEIYQSAEIVAMLGSERGRYTWGGTFTNIPGLTTLSSTNSGYGWIQLHGTIGSPGSGMVLYSMPINHSSTKYRVQVSLFSTEDSIVRMDAGINTTSANGNISEGLTGPTFVVPAYVPTTTNIVITTTNYSYNHFGQTVNVTLALVTNNLYVTDLQIERCQPLFSPSTNSGWRLPARY